MQSATLTTPILIKLPRSKVKLPPSGRINDRACIELNEEVELGARVAVDVLEEHVYSLYKLMKMPLSGALKIICA